MSVQVGIADEANGKLKLISLISLRVKNKPELVIKFKAKKGAVTPRIENIRLLKE